VPVGKIAVGRPEMELDAAPVDPGGGRADVAFG